MKKAKGSITVFLSLIGILFLSLICTLVESARVQGARAKATAITDIGLFSMFGEYEPEVLAEFDVFVLDGAYGSGAFNQEYISERLHRFADENISDDGFVLFPIGLAHCAIPAYTLVTDNEGNVFYQQAVSSQKTTLAGDLLAKYTSQLNEAQKQEEEGKACEQNSEQLKDEITRMQEEAIAGQETAEEKQQAEDTDQEESLPTTTPEAVENPLEIIDKIREMGILGLVVKDPASLSSQAADQSSIPSGRELKTGNLEIKEEHSGLVADGIFLEYLNHHYANYVSPKRGLLQYEMEYILAGKESDQENLKSIVHRLLLMREGSNFLYAMGNEQMRQQALLLATAIMGPLGVPGLVNITQGALLLAWSYGESLLDVRMLLAGGKVPLVKSSDSWKQSLENLINLLDILESCDQGGGEGMGYEDYLNILMLTGNKNKYSMRALDLLEGRIRAVNGLEDFRVDHCIVKVKASSSWDLEPVFLSVPQAFLGTGNVGTSLEVEGYFQY